MITVSNRARDEALGWERHSYDVMLLTRTDRRHHRPLRGGARPLRARRGRRTPAPPITTNGARPAARSASCSGWLRSDPEQARRVARAAQPCSSGAAASSRPAARAAAAPRRARAALALLPGRPRRRPLPALRAQARGDRRGRARRPRRGGWRETQGLVARADTLYRLARLARGPDRARRGRPRPSSPGAPSSSGVAGAARGRERGLARARARAGGAGAHPRAVATPMSGSRPRRPSAPPPRRSCARSRRWRRSASSPAASPTISTTCSRSSSAASISPGASCTARAARSSSTSTMRWRAPPAPPR